jgi:HSP20 family molecular chaperone IbpA
MEHLEVQDAKFKDGVLVVDMKLNLPEEKKPRTIKIK